MRNSIEIDKKLFLNNIADLYNLFVFISKKEQSNKKNNEIK